MTVEQLLSDETIEAVARVIAKHYAEARHFSDPQPRDRAFARKILAALVERARA